MSDLSYTIQVNGVQDLDKLSGTIDKLNGVLKSGNGSGKSLEEIRRIIVGMKGSASVFTELKDAVKELNSSAKSLRTGFQASLKELTIVMKQTMQESAAMMRTAGAEQGKALAQGIESSTSEVSTAIKKQGRTLSAVARAEATKMYEAMVMNNPNAKMTDRGLAALLNLEGSGATLSPYHKNLVRQVRESGKRGNAAIVAAVKAEQDELQAALKSLEARSAARSASLSGVYAESLAEGKSNVSRVKAGIAAERRELQAAVTAEQDALQAALRNMDTREAVRRSSLAGIYADSLSRGNSETARVKTRLTAQRKELENTVAAETAALQAALASMEARDAVRSSSLAGIYATSLANGKGEVSRVKATLKAQAKEIEATVTAETAALQAALKAMEERSGLRSKSLAGVYADSLARGKGDIARVKAELKEQADEIEAAALAQQARIRKSVSAAMNAPAGQYQRYNAGTGMAGGIVGEVKTPKPKEIDDVSKSLKGLGDNMNYAHSMSRGLASGFNLLWLTWGDLAPLFIGAAISNGFMQTAKQGMEVAHTFAIIGNVGGNTAEQVAALNTRMLELAKQGPFGPSEIAEAMKTLSLAGLQANEILKVTGDVLNFSVAGTTTIEKAAETLVQVSTAFGMGSAGFSYASDVISKAAADSMTSVEAFSNAMKTASVIGQQYGVSLQDTALGIGTLANLGIQATAAGTALRNMYADLSGRSIKVAKILKQQGIEMRDATGAFRPMIEVVAELNEHMLKMDPISAKNFMQALLSERGAKGMVEMLRLIRTEARDMGAGFNNALEEVRAGMENNAAFAAITAAKMSQTAKNQFKTMGSVLQASMQEAYESMEPQLILVFQRMQEAFGSPEFVATITSLIGGLASLAKVMADNADVLAALAIGYATLKTAQAATLGTASLLQAASALFAKTKTAETAALVADTAAQTANNVAKAAGVGALGKAAGALSIVGRAIPYVNVALGVGTAAWMAYQFWANKSTDTAKEAADNYTNNVAKALEDEAARLAKINALRATGISLAAAEDKLNQQIKSGQNMAEQTKQVDDARSAYEKAIAAQKKFNETGEGGSGLNIKRSDADRARYANRLESDVKSAWDNLSTAVSNAERAGNRIKKAEDELKRQSKERTSWLLEDQKKQADELAKMFKGEESFTQAGADSEKFKRLFIAFDNEMKMVSQRANDTLAMEKKLASDQQKILQAKHQAGIISEGEYQAELLALTEKSAEEQVEAVLKGVDAFMAAANKRKQYLEGLAKTATGPNAEAVKNELENLSRETITFTEAAYRSIVEIQSGAATGVQTAAFKAQGTLKKLNDSIKDFWRKDQGEQNKARALFELEKQYRYINESVFSMDVAQRAAAEAGTAAMAKYNVELEKLNEELATATAQLAILKARGMGPGNAAYDSLSSLVDGLNKSIDDMTQRAIAGAAQASTLAFEKARADQVAKFSSDISGAITTALFEGGKAGRKKLRDIIVSELQKPITLYINAFVNQIMGGMLGGSGGGVGGAVNSLSGMYDMVSGAYNLFSSGGSLSSMAAGYVSQAGNLFGSAAVGEFAAGMQGLSASAGATGWAGGTWSAAGTQASGAVTSGVVGGGSTTTAASGMGSAAGSALNIAGGVAGGIYGGRMISGGYGLGGGSGNTAVNTGTAIGAAVGSIFPVIGTALGALVGGLIGGVVNRVFGRKLKEMGIEGTFGGELGFKGNEYKFEKGGWFASDKTTRTPLDEGTRQGLAGQYAYLANTTQDMAKILGVGASVIENFTYSIKVNLKGLSDEEIAKKLEEEFVKMGNAMALSVLGTDQYSRVNESSMETLARLSSTLKTVNSAMGNLGGTLYATSLYGANMAQSLVDLFGGLDTFANSMNSYYNNFYTEQERTANLTRDLTGAMKELGFTMPTSREEFRKIVDATLALGVKGQPTLVALMNMQELFASLYPTIEEANTATDKFETALDNVKDLMSEIEKLNTARKSAGSLVDRIDEAMGRPTGNYAWEREQELWGMISKAGYADQVEMASELTDLVMARMERERENADLQLATAAESKKFWQQTLDFVASLTTGSLSPLTTEQKLAQAQQDYYNTYAKAVQGDTDAQGKLQGSAETYLDLARMFYASSQAYTDIFNSVTGGLTSAANQGILNANNPTSPTNYQSESYDQLMQLRTISANAYDQLSAQLVTAQNLLAVDYNLLSIQAQQLGKTEEIAGLLDTLPAEIALSLPAFNTSVFEALGYNQARTVESLENVRAELVLARETNTQEAHMQAAIYAETFEKMLAALAEVVSHANQQRALAGQGLV